MLIALINHINVFLSVIIFGIIYFIPNYLLESYKKSESVLLIKDLKNITENILLYLTSYVSLKQAMKYVSSCITYKRFQEAFSQFAYDYEAHEYDIVYAGNILNDKFDSDELKAFLSMLKQSEKEGNLIENLQKYAEIIELGYFKYLKKQTVKRISYVALGTIVSLVNIVLVVMYPLFMQVFASLQYIFS